MQKMIHVEQRLKFKRKCATVDDDYDKDQTNLLEMIRSRYTYCLSVVVG